MAGIVTYTIPFTSGSAGTANPAALTTPVNGALWSVYVDPGSSGSGLTVTARMRNGRINKKILGPVNVTAKTEYFPRGASCSVAGTVGTDTTQFIPLDGSLEVAITGAGDTKTGFVSFQVVE